MKKIAVLLIILLSGVACAEKAEAKKVKPAKKAETPLPAWEKNEAGQDVYMNFTIPLKPINEPSMMFGHFSGSPLVVFYFSTYCPHCQRAFPRVLKLANDYKAKGINVITIASGSNTQVDILKFIREQKSTIPMFHDNERILGSLLQIRYVPLMLYIDSDGRFRRFGNFNPDEDQLLRKNLDQILKK